MKCLSFAYMLIIVIVLSIWFSLQSSAVNAYMGMVTSAVVLYWLAGFFLPCN